MREFTLREVEKAVSGKLIMGDPDATIKGIAIDSRKVTADQLFFAIIGERNDAHKFIPQVVESGCKSVIISDPEALKMLEASSGAAGSEASASAAGGAPGGASGAVNAILVEDTTKAMTDLAAYYLEMIPAKKVCVTGSVGKTSTRDMVYYILNSKFKAGRNVGNFNSEYGVAMTVMDFDEDLEAIVLEIGMDRFGEIDRLVNIIHPSVGIITNVGVSHIENLGSREGILKAKMEITNCFAEDDVLIVNESCDLLSIENTKGNYRLKTAGEDTYDDAFVFNVMDYGDEGIEYTLAIEGEEYNVRLFIPGGHNAINSALAILAGREFGISVEDSIKALQEMELTGKRLTLREGNGVKVIDDTYNACPDSMKSALRSLVATKGKRKVAILGDMYELGKDSPVFHEEVGAYAAKLKGLDVLISVGELGKSITDGACRNLSKDNADCRNLSKDNADCRKLSTYHFDTKEKLYPELNKLIQEGDIVLVKSSNGLHTETIVEEILK